MNSVEPLKAMVEIRKTLAEFQIFILDQQAHTLALESTLLELGGFRAHDLFPRRLAEEQSKRLADRKELQTVVEKLTKVIRTLEPPLGPVN